MKTGQTIGRYRVEGLVGAGAMGEVYRAYDPVIDRPVAIKILRPELMADSGPMQWLQRFRREARAAGRRSHPNIVAIWDFGDDNGTPFLAMEYVDGRGLDELIKSSRQLETRRAVAIITQVLSALGFAHENEIVHRDVKPSNIIVLPNDDVKVADFGIARVYTAEFTVVGDLMGTPAYMAPEQLWGAPVDFRVDLYAAGVVLFEMLTGVKPFRGKSITEIMSCNESWRPEDLKVLNPAVPDALERVINKSLAFDPSQRYADTAAFSEAILAAVATSSGEPLVSEITSSAGLITETKTRLIARAVQTLPGKASLHPEPSREIASDPATSGNSSDAPRIPGRFAARVFPLSRMTVFSAGLAAMATSIGIAGLPMWHEPQLLSARASIMVLPFRNLNGPGEDYFTDAVTDNLTTDLSRLSDTTVIARATAFTYKGKPADAREIRREFGVRYVLAGSIQKIGTRVQANAELIDTGSASSLWAERFQSEITEPFALQEAVTGRIAASLHLQLVRAENRRTVAQQTTDPDAYDLRLRAMAYLIDKITPESTLAARRALEKSLALDPNSAEAWSELAHVLIIDVFRSWNNATKELLVQAEEAVRKAYAIDRSVALAHFAEGKIHQLRGDFQSALDALSEALQLDPNLAMAYAQKAPDLIFLGRAQEAPVLVTKAIDLSPRDPDLGLFYWFKGHAYFAMKDYDNAIHWVQKSVEDRPAVWSSRAYLISAFALTGRLGQHEAQAAVHEYSGKFNNWPLDPKIKEWAGDKRFRDAHPDYKATLQEFLRGLQIAKDTAGFP